MLNKKSEEVPEKGPFDEERKVKGFSFVVPFLIFIVGAGLSVFFAGFFYIAQYNANDATTHNAKLEISNYVISEIESYQRTVRLVSSLIEVSDLRDMSALQNRIVYNIPEISQFDRVVMVTRTEKSWKVKDLITPSSDGIEFYPNWGKVSYKNLVSYMLNNEVQHSSTMKMFSSIPGTRYWQQSSEPIVRAKPFAVVQRLTAKTGEDIIVVGLTRVTKVLDTQWIAEHQNISDMIISNASTSDVLLQLDRRSQNKKSMEEILAMDSYSFNLGDQHLSLHLVINSTTGGLVAYVPLCIGALGTLLSVLVAMFYGSSRKKNRKLKKLSSSYVQKNYELNIELAERERLHNLLFSAEREFRILVDSVSDIVLEISPQSEIIFTNKAWEKITGFSVESSLDQPFFNYVHNDDVEDLRGNFKLVFRGQKFSHHSRLRLKTDEGRYRQVQLSISSIRNEDKSQPRLIMTIMDIEAQQRTKKALSEAEEKYRKIIEHAAGGFYQVTLEGQILSANPSLLHILGFDTEEHMRESVEDLFAFLFDMNAEKARFLKELEVHGAVKNFENRAKTFRKKDIWINQNARTVKDDHGNILYIEGSLENVSQRKEFEQKLKQAKIESDLANRAKSEFLANMSHELRTPLNAIIGFSEIIKDEVLGPVQNKQYWEYASDIYKSGKSLLKIINEILDVSRIETGERQLNESNVDLNKVVESCFDFARNRMEEASQLTITNMSEGKLPSLVGEELAIKQIFLNILSNAIKFTPAGGRITLSHEINSVGDVMISVTDTGIGLNENEIEKALSPFGQVDTAMSREGSGAGLGLNLVNSLTRLHDGKLELFSQKGVGTTVTVTLPAKRVTNIPVEDGEGGQDSASEQQQSVVEDVHQAGEPAADVFATDEPEADVFAKPEEIKSSDDKDQAPVKPTERVESKYTKQAEELSEEDRQKADVFENFFSDDDESEDGTSPTIQ